MQNLEQDDFLTQLDLKDDPFDQDPSVEPNLEKKLSQEPVMKKEDSFQYKMTELHFPDKAVVEEDIKLEEGKQYNDTA